MNTSWAYHFMNTTTFILGNKKNAGKTTFMNHALSLVRKETCPAIGSIGIDGESNDLINGRPKPSIFTQQGDVVITTQPMLNKSDAKFRLIKVFPIYTALGQVVIAKTIRSGNIELVGTENNMQLNEVLTFLKENKCHTVIMDGAANRMTPITSNKNAGFFYVLNIDVKNLFKAMDTIKRLNYLSSCKNINEINVDKGLNIYPIKGALTINKLRQIPKSCNSLLINDISSVFINYQQLLECCKQYQIILNNNHPLKAIVVVLKDVDKDDFLKLYDQNKISLPLIFNPYVN